MRGTDDARYDTSRRRWRHLDFGACQVWLEADIHRIDCRSCARVRTEQVSWARPNARHTTDFENIAAWLAQRMDKASIARLLRCADLLDLQNALGATQTAVAGCCATSTTRRSTPTDRFRVRPGQRRRT